MDYSSPLVRFFVLTLLVYGGFPPHTTISPFLRLSRINLNLVVSIRFKYSTIRKTGTREQIVAHLYILSLSVAANSSKPTMQCEDATTNPHPRQCLGRPRSNSSSCVSDSSDRSSELEVDSLPSRPYSSIGMQRTHTLEHVDLVGC
jgi:hypothetical protein